jgi:hypothetical protein
VQLRPHSLPVGFIANAILLFEATEGGAGVLGQLTSEPRALSRVVRKALAQVLARAGRRNCCGVAGDNGLCGCWAAFLGSSAMALTPVVAEQSCCCLAFS